VHGSSFEILKAFPSRPGAKGGGPPAVAPRIRELEGFPAGPGFPARPDGTMPSRTEQDSAGPAMDSHQREAIPVCGKSSIPDDREPGTTLTTRRE